MAHWSRTVTEVSSGPWIRSRRWDLTFIYGSVLLVVVPLATYYVVSFLTGHPPQSFQERPALSLAMAVNLACAFLIGGPHMYATYTLTVAERRFRRDYPELLWAAGAVPIVVVALAVMRVELLMMLFFMWASAHAIHQLVFLVGQYHARAGTDRQPAAWSRGLDYVLMMSALYPVAFWRLLAPTGSVLHLPFAHEIRPGFPIGAIDISRELPQLVHGAVWVAWAMFGVFGVALALFLARTTVELARGRVVWPRTLLLVCTVPVLFAVPLFENLDVALQGINLWHSAQYIGLVYLMNAYRRQRGEMSSSMVRWLSAPTHWYRYYGFLIAVSVLAGGLIGVLHYGAGVPMLQAYYGVHLSALWIHYLWDHLVFGQRGALDPVPVAA